MVHTMRVQNDVFESILAGTKEVEYRLYDTKRSKIKAGDTIIFTNIKDNRQLETRVLKLYRAHTFSELRTTILVREGRIKDFKDFIPQDMLKYYSKDDIFKNGVVGIWFDYDKDEPKPLNPLHDSAPQIVAEYVIKRIKDELYHEYRWICGRSHDQTLSRAAWKLKKIYTSDMLVLMAYAVKCLSREISEEEFNAVLQGYPGYTPRDVKVSLINGKTLNYSLYGLQKKDQLKDYLDDSNKCVSKSDECISTSDPDEDIMIVAGT